MQDPNTGDMHPLESLDDPKRKGKEDWPVYHVGDRVRFRGWWWEITAIAEGGLVVTPAHRASRDDVDVLTKELARARKRAKSGADG